MPLNIRNEEVNRLAERLAARTHMSKTVSVGEAQEDVTSLLRLARIQTVAIGDPEVEAALDAFARFGKGRGHPAQLNMGDCFAYAVAKANRTARLCKGDDFSKTDIPPAVPPRSQSSPEGS